MEIQKELIAEYDRETATTRKTLEAIPADADYAYKPHGGLSGTMIYWKRLPEAAPG